MGCKQFGLIVRAAGTLCLLLLFLAAPFISVPTAFAQSSSGSQFSTSFPKKVLQSFEQLASGFQRSGHRGSAALQLPTREGGITVHLEPHEIRSADYRAQAIGPHGVQSVSSDIAFFRGESGTEKDGEFFRFVLLRSPKGELQLDGYFRSRNSYYRVAPAEHDGLEYTVSSMSQEDINQLVRQCGVEGVAHHHSETHAQLRQAALPNTLREIELATDADAEFVANHGGVTQALNRQLAVVNGVNGIYEQELGFTIKVVFQNSWTNAATDPYTSSNSGTLLNELRAYWQSNFSSVRTYDLAHLFTGRDLDGSTVGVAYLGATCGSFRYGLSQLLGSNSLDVPLVAHECGHNLGTDHFCNGADDIMCPSLQANANRFYSQSRGQISAHTNSVSCLSQGGGGGGGGGSGAPVLAGIGPKTVTEGQLLQFPVSATDPDNDSLTFSVSGLAGAAISGGVFSYQPPVGTVPSGQSFTTRTVTIAVSDGTLSDSEAVSITINAAPPANRDPVLTNPGVVNAREGAVMQLQLSASDPDGDILRYLATKQLPPGLVLDHDSGLMSWKPGGNQAGNYSIEITVTDGRGGTDQEVFTIQVANDASAPNYPARHAFPDFKGTGKANLVVYRAPTGEWFNRSVSGGSVTALQFGLPGDIPVSADWDGDRITDRAVFRPSINVWFIRSSSTGQVVQRAFGVGGDIPVRGDFDGDGRNDLAVFRPGGQLFIYRSSKTDVDVVLTAGKPGDLPAACDYDGDGAAEFATFRPSSGTWHFYSASGETTLSLGRADDLPVPADYDGDGDCDPMVYRSQTGEWIGVNGAVQFGLPADIPFPMDTDGDGKANHVVFRPSQAIWYIRQNNGQAEAVQFGLFDDLTQQEPLFFAARTTSSGGFQARSDQNSSVFLYRRSSQTLFSAGLSTTAAAFVPATVGSYFLRADYDGDGVQDFASWTNGNWTVFLATGVVNQVSWGLPGDVPVTGDFDGDGISDIAVFRPNALYSEWYIVGSRAGAYTVSWGLAGDVPITGDFNGDGFTDLGVFRPGPALWFIYDSRGKSFQKAVQWGLPSDQPLVSDYDNDGRSDISVFRPSIGFWFVLGSSGSVRLAQWGLPGDEPVPGKYLAEGDYAVWRPSTATLYVLSQSGLQFAAFKGLASSDQVVGRNPNTPVQ